MAAAASLHCGGVSCLAAMLSARFGARCGGLRSPSWDHLTVSKPLSNKGAQPLHTDLLWVEMLPPSEDRSVF